LDLSGLGSGPMEGSYEHGNKFLSVIIFCTNLEKLSDWRLLKKNSALRTYCGMFAQSKKCGARETVIDSGLLWNNIRF
jgi:hypothetical protein